MLITLPSPIGAAWPPAQFDAAPLGLGLRSRAHGSALVRRRGRPATSDVKQTRNSAIAGIRRVRGSIGNHSRTYSNQPPRAEKARHALMSSWFNSECFASTSSMDMPDARYERTSDTVIGMHRMHGWPLRTFGSTVM